MSDGVDLEDALDLAAAASMTDDELLLKLEQLFAAAERDYEQALQAEWDRIIGKPSDTKPTGLVGLLDPGSPAHQ